MNVKLIDSLVHIIQSLTSEERLALDARLHNDSSEATSTSARLQSSVLDGEPTLRGSSASDLLQFADTWEGDDFEDCLQLVYETRSKAEF